MVDCYEEKCEFQNALNQCEKTLKLLDLLECGSNWNSVREAFVQKMEGIKAKQK